MIKEEARSIKRLYIWMADEGLITAEQLKKVKEIIKDETMILD